MASALPGWESSLGQWPAGHYTVICSCGKPLLTRDGTGVHVASNPTETPPPVYVPPTASTRYDIGADKAMEPDHGKDRGKHKAA